VGFHTSSIARFKIKNKALSLPSERYQVN